MNLRPVLFLASLILASSLFGDESPFEFSGVMTTGGKTRIALTDPSTKTTVWLEPGQQFRGYTVARYDAGQDVVFLRKAGKETRLTLVPEKGSDASRATTAASLAAESTAASIRANLRLLTSAARQYQLEHGVTTATYADLVGPDKLIKELKPIAGEDYSTLSFGPTVTGVNVTTANGTIVALDLPATAAASSASLAQQAVEATSGASSVASNPAASTSTASSGSPSTPPPANPALATLPASGTDALQPTGRQPASPNYAVQPGDTWERISVTTGVPVLQLKQMNPGIREGTPLPSGQMIRVK